MTTMPLFPLPLVLFPGGKLPLQIFETRYVDMIRESLQQDAGFGIVLIRRGEQSLKSRDTATPEVCPVGTSVQIVDFDQSTNGLLSVMVQGQLKFRTNRLLEREDRLLMAEVSFVEAEPEQLIPGERIFLVELLQTLAAHEAVRSLGLQINYSDAGDVGCRLAELIPVSNERKQRLLELDDPLVRLDELAVLITRLQQMEPLQ